MFIFGHDAPAFIRSIYREDGRLISRANCLALIIPENAPPVLLKLYLGLTCQVTVHVQKKISYAKNRDFSVIAPRLYIVSHYDDFLK
jgi:hypothetical protein